MTLAWPDLVIGGITLFFAIKGFRNGFVAELAGTIALIIALIAAFWYPGVFDNAVHALTGLTSGSAHMLGLVLWAILAYAVVMFVAWLLGRIARLPVIGIANGIGGALLGGGKVLLGAWAVLYVLLFLPLPNDLRADLHRSSLVQLVTAPDEQIDATLRGALPWFVRPFMGPIFDHHKA